MKAEQSLGSKGFIRSDVPLAASTRVFRDLRALMPPLISWQPSYQRGRYDIGGFYHGVEKMKEGRGKGHRLWFQGGVRCAGAAEQDRLMKGGRTMSL
jgi:hypothetical protein